VTERITVDALGVLAERPTPPTQPPVLFVHGMQAGAWAFANYQRFFADRGYPNYAVDLRGRPGSRAVADLGRVSMRDYVEDGLAVAAEVARLHGGTRPVVVGHSMGGLIAQKMAEADAVSAAVLLCSAPPRGIVVSSPRLLSRQLKFLWPIVRSKPIAGTRADHDLLTFHRVPEAERQALFERFGPESGRVGLELSVGAIAVDARRVRCPVLVVSAGEDRFVPPGVARRLAKKYRAPHLEFGGFAHFMVSEPGWERPAEAIERWVAGVAGEHGTSAARPPGGPPPTS
jgi:pimeloyl-ACP methyl ester carboxylesterase